MEGFKALTGKDRRRVAVLAPPPGEDANEVEICRMAMIAHDENPVNAGQVVEYLNLPKRQYDKYIQAFTDQLAVIIRYTDEGGAVVLDVVKDENGELVEGEVKVDVKPVLGRHRRKFNIKKPSDFLVLMPEFTGLTDEEVDALPINLHNGITTSLAFLAGLIETEED